MIDDKFNWYREAQTSSDIFHEAGAGDVFKKTLLAVALIFSGLSLVEVSNRTGLAPEQIQQALNNDQVVQQAEQIYSDKPSEPQVTPQEEVKPKAPNALDFTAIENLIRKHEVSGKDRMVTTPHGTFDIRIVYPDPIYGMKVPTIGVGYNLNRSEARSEIASLGLDYDRIRSGDQKNPQTDQMLTDEQVNSLFRNDVAKSIAMARKFLPNFNEQPTAVKTVLSDMAFNLGETRLNKFKKLRAALMNFDYPEAKAQMIDSAWHGQVGNRAITLENMIEGAQFPQSTQEPSQEIPNEQINYN